jgi:hypothetical protein
MLRQLKNEEVEKFAKEKGADESVVKTFLSTLNLYNTAFVARLNLRREAKKYGWNRETIIAIDNGIRLADEKTTLQNTNNIPAVEIEGETCKSLPKKVVKFASDGKSMWYEKKEEA